MPRYIDADEFVKRVIQYPRQSTKTIGLALADTPTANVVERKRGKWIQRSDTPWYYYCSNCHRVISVTSADQIEKFHAFCGTCGADMRGETEDAEISN